MPVQFLKSNCYCTVTVTVTDSESVRCGGHTELNVKKMVLTDFECNLKD